MVAPKGAILTFFLGGFSFINFFAVFVVFFVNSRDLYSFLTRLTLCLEKKKIMKFNAVYLNMELMINHCKLFNVHV